MLKVAKKFETDGRALRHLRLTRDLRTSDLAERAYINPATVTRAERGTTLTPVVAHSIAAALGSRIEDFARPAM